MLKSFVSAHILVRCIWGRAEGGGAALPPTTAALCLCHSPNPRHDSICRRHCIGAAQQPKQWRSKWPPPAAAAAGATAKSSTALLPPRLQINIRLPRHCRHLEQTPCLCHSSCNHRAAAGVVAVPATELAICTAQISRWLQLCRPPCSAHATATSQFAAGTVSAAHYCATERHNHHYNTICCWRAAAAGSN